MQFSNQSLQKFIIGLPVDEVGRWGNPGAKENSYQVDEGQVSRISVEQ